MLWGGPASTCWIPILIPRNWRGPASRCWGRGGAFASKFAFPTGRGGVAVSPENKPKSLIRCLGVSPHLFPSPKETVRLPWCPAGVLFRAAPHTPQGFGRHQGKEEKEAGVYGFTRNYVRFTGGRTQPKIRSFLIFPGFPLFSRETLSNSPSSNSKKTQSQPASQPGSPAQPSPAQSSGDRFPRPASFL